jgi:hypothetical protein
MNLNNYYDKIHETEQQISGDCAVIVSQETPDGGRAGVVTEAPKRVASRLIVEGAARLATTDEAAAFRSANQKAKAEADDAAAASKVQFTVIPAAELQSIKRGNLAKA